MSISPKGMSIQEAYKNYKENKFIVNRKYQRKLVWDMSEKKALIDSIQKDYPIPLILLAQDNKGCFEIVDGMQRLNAIFGFIENAFSDENNEYFDVKQFVRANLIAESGGFEKVSDESTLLKPNDCANFLDYQLAVTIFTSDNEMIVTDVFGRINSGGRQLSRQEKRQAGMLDAFSSLVRKLSSEFRGDVSRDVLYLSEMPEISIDTPRTNLKYSLKSENIFWVNQGIIWATHLKQSEDEEIIADIVSSIVFSSPINRSAELLDNMYDEDSEEHTKLLAALSQYGEDKVFEEVKTVFSVLKEIIENSSQGVVNALRKKVNPKSSNPIKAVFYSIFLAMHELIVKDEKTPAEYCKIMDAFDGLQSKITRSANHAKSEDREKNIDMVKGLIQKYFVKKEPSMLGHGAGLALDFENSLRRSKIETSQYECKQGLLSLGENRKINQELMDKIFKTVCGMANMNLDGYLFIGVADDITDVEKIIKLDSIEPVPVDLRYVVGIDRECLVLKIEIEKYQMMLVSKLRSSTLSTALKATVSIDLVTYKDLSVIRIKVPRQNEISYFNDEAYRREGSSTIKVSQPEAVAISSQFSRNL